MTAQPLPGETGAFLISSQLTLGISEVDTVRDTLECVAELIKLERRAEKAVRAEQRARSANGY
jgi:protein-arginine kinase